MGEHPAQVCDLSLCGVRRPMDIFFCDICNESVPQTDLERGMAFRRGERVVCAACDNAMSNEEEGATVPAEEGSTPKEPEGDGVVESESGQEESGEVPQVSSDSPERSSGGPRLSSCLFALLFALLLISVGANALLWMEGQKVRASLDASLEGLQKEDDMFSARFSDLQTNLSRQGQKKDAYVRESLEMMRGGVDEKFANLGNRLGRNENSLEALRQSTSADRRTLEASGKDAVAAAGVAATAVESVGEDLSYLSDRVTALEEVLEGGMTPGRGGGGDQQPGWYSHLPELKDASAGNRWNAVTVLGDTGDPRVVPHLLPMLSDEDVFVRMATARVLGDLGIPAAIPALIKALSDEQAAVREASVVALRVLSGKDFRFDPLGKETDRAKAQGSWRKWWDDNSEALLGS